MTTRQNTKRKGRGGGGPTRERTYTTLTGSHPSGPPHSSFPSTTTTTPTTFPAMADDVAANANANIMSSPFSVASSADGSPNYQTYDFANPMHLYPNYHNGFSIPTMPPLGGASAYNQQPQLQQYYQQPPPQSAQNDLEVLQRLKETIKNNQHDVFRPIPQPSALASIYLGPPSAVPPHPEQAAGDRQLGQTEYDSSSRDVAASGNPGNNIVSQTRTRRGSDVWDTRRPAGYTSSGNGAQGLNTNNASGAHGPGSQRFEEKAMDVDHSGPPGLAAPPRRDYHNNGRSDKNTASEPAPGGIGNSLPPKGSAYDSKDDPRSGRDRDSLFNGRYGNTTQEDVKPSLGLRDRRPGSPDPRRELDNNRGRYADARDRRDREPERKEGGPNWDRYRPRDRDDRLDNRYPPRDFDRDRRFPPRYQNTDNSLRRNDSKSSVTDPTVAPLGTSANLPGARDRERSVPPDSQPPRPLTEERSFGRYDDRRPPPPPLDRRPIGPPDDRRGPPPPLDVFLPTQPQAMGRDRDLAPPPTGRPTDDRARDSRAGPPPSLGDRISRPPVRQPSLRDRIGGGPEPSSATFTRPGERQVRSTGAPEERSAVMSAPPTPRDTPRPVGTAPTAATTSDVRPPSSSVPDTAARPTDARANVSATTNTSSTEPPRPAAASPAVAAEERGRPVNNDRLRQSSGPVPERERVNSGPARGNYPGNNAPARVSEDRTFKPRGTTVSPSRRDFKPGFYDRDRRPDSANVMDVDAPSRFPGSATDRVPPPPASYRRPSPPPFNRDRPWVPYSGDNARRHPADAHGGAPYTRDWRDDERGGYGGDDWDRRSSWDRDRDRDGPPRDRGDGRFVERDAVPGGGAPTWETREERDRRVSYGGTSDAPPPPNSASTTRSTYENRPLSSRLTDGYPAAASIADDRDRDRDRPPYGRDYDRRYPPPPLPLDADAPGGPYSRVRPRSPSPPPSARRPGVDDMRPPPLKRARDDGYPPSAASGAAGTPGYYTPPPPPPDAPPAAPDYHLAARMRTPPVSAGAYYDADRDREREFVDDGIGYGRYDGRLPPPRSPPPYGRPGYRDDRRYPPPRP
ncbi:hypothetical protein EUX98_g7347 [Antrodiella citrinella]|uniref:Uncharacterized protein n=1 Tax=Antrodiella citrinella TaxID=2447956 RepID=A0A4S4MU48_9APHY|nr:hypothetical protein EUX98_g7347 [Antrodiella citrinella]